MLFAIALVTLGFILLIWSADQLVENASQLASQMGVSTFLVGVVIVGFGTSAPEMFVSAMAAIQDKGNLAVGNALGSNITNIGLVLGSAALVRALPISLSAARIDIPVVIATGVLAIVLILDGELSHLDGVLLIATLIAYLVWSTKFSSASAKQQIDLDISHPRTKGMAFLFTVGSIIVLMLASRMLVKGSIEIATFLGVSELVIGLTIVAIGTSLPELAAAVAAARKGQHDMIIGNIIGSNVFNTLGVLGITGAIRTTTIDTSALWRDFPVMFIFTVFMFVFALSKGGFSRREGAILLSGYGLYVCYLIFTSIR